MRIGFLPNLPGFSVFNILFLRNFEKLNKNTLEPISLLKIKIKQYIEIMCHKRTGAFITRVPVLCKSPGRHQSSPNIWHVNIEVAILETRFVS